MTNIRRLFLIVIAILIVEVSCRKQYKMPTYPQPIQQIVDAYFVPFVETEEKSDFERFSLSTQRLLIANEIVAFLTLRGWNVSQKWAVIHATMDEGNFTYELQVDTINRTMDIHIVLNTTQPDK